MQRPFVRLLGTASLHPGAGAPVALLGERRNQVLVYLACSGHWTTRDELAELLWPERSQSAARSNLRNVVMQIRRGAIEGFEARADALRWQIATDVQDFERAFAAGDSQAALAVYGGTLLPGFEADAPAAFANWLAFERTRLLNRRQDALTARLPQLSEDAPACAALAAQALRDDPLNEAALRAFIRAQLTPGAVADARRAWRIYVERLANDHGVEPAAELRALSARLREQVTPPDFRPAAPATRVDCIGRRLELRQIGELLADAGCRLLTLTGPGGVGKSTLARAVVPSLAAQFDDGCVWVALDDLTLIDQAAPRVAARLGLELRGSNPPLAQVTRHVGEKQLLLVFDNAEHLFAFDLFVQTLLHDCPRLRVLVTSRVRLAAPGEWLLPLDGLPVPDRDERTVEVLRAFDAIKLFELRARALAPGFDLATHAADVVALAHAVEGLPLALELAAASTRLLPVSAIVEELARSLDVLEAAPTANARDRGLRASFDHSWRMLTPAERDVLPRLAVFVGTFSRAAAEQVARAPLSILGALVDKSLLRAAGDGRFSLHALLRQCALERLPDTPVARLRHAEYYAQFLARCGDRVDARSANATIEPDLQNCLVAWQTLLEAHLPAGIEKMASPLGRFFDLRGRLDEGIALLQPAVHLFDAARAGELRPYGRLQWNLANLLFRKAGFADAEKAARLALRAFASARDREGIAGCLNTLGLCLWQRGLREEARRHYERALRRARIDGDPVHADKIEHNLAIIEKALGLYDAALARYVRALEKARQAEDLSRVVTTLNNLGNLHRARQEPAVAIAYFEEGARLCREANFAGSEPFLVLNLATTHFELGAVDEAEQFAQRAFGVAREHGVRQIEVGAPLVLARVAISRGRYPAALELIHESLAMARASDYEVWQVEALGSYAELAAATGRRVLAGTYLKLLAADTRAEAFARTRATDALERLHLSEREARAADNAAATLTLGAAVDAIVAEATSMVA